jgi:hypothetical protein
MACGVLKPKMTWRSFTVNPALILMRVMLIPVAVKSMTGIRFISFTLLFRHRAGTEPAQLALKL